MLLTILAVHTAAVTAGARAAGRRAGAVSSRAAVSIIGGAVGVLAWKKLPTLLHGFCIHFLNFRAYADGRADLYE